MKCFLLSRNKWVKAIISSKGKQGCHFLWKWRKNRVDVNHLEHELIPVKHGRFYACVRQRQYVIKNSWNPKFHRPSAMSCTYSGQGSLDFFRHVPLLKLDLCTSILMSIRFKIGLHHTREDILRYICSWAQSITSEKHTITHYMILRPPLHQELPTIYRSSLANLCSHTVFSIFLKVFLCSWVHAQDDISLSLSTTSVSS